MKKTIIKSQLTELLDLTYFAQYQPQLGFIIAVDGFHNTQEKNPHTSVCFLNTPDIVQKLNSETGKFFMNCNLDWESPMTSPQFLEDYFYFENIYFKPYLTLIFQAYTIVFNKKGPTMKILGWTALPIFHSSGHIQSGVYQLPLFKGLVSQEILDYISHNEAWTYFNVLLGEKNSPLKLLEPMSIVVRLLDRQREVFLEKSKSNIIGTL